MDIDNNTADKINKLFDIAKSRNEKEYEWFKTSILTISTIFGLLISLKTKKSSTIIEHNLFIITLILFGLCILVGLIFLYAETSTLHKVFKSYREKLLLGEKNILVSESPFILFSLMRKLFFLFLVLSFVSLIIYVIYTDI